MAELIIEADGEGLDVLALDETSLGAKILFFSFQLSAHGQHVRIGEPMRRSSFIKIINLQNWNRNRAEWKPTCRGCRNRSVAAAAAKR